MTSCPYRALWASVLSQMIRDGLGHNVDEPGRREKDHADGMIRGNSQDFRQVCALAGIDSDAVREAYIAGRIDYSTKDGRRRLRNKGQGNGQGRSTGQGESENAGA